jgi:hypothetical protein
VCGVSRGAWQPSRASSIAATPAVRASQVTALDTFLPSPGPAR